MAAEWHLLTEYLAASGDAVQLTWTEFNAIVGGLPASAIDHYPQWWHGDRPNTRAWRAAGYEAVDIRPGASVRFVRSSPVTKGGEVGAAHRPARPATNPSVASLAALQDLDAAGCLIVIPCSATKRRGGQPGTPTPSDPALETARRRVLDMGDSSTDESRLMPAWQRYRGALYTAVGDDVLADLAASGRLDILSGGYGVLGGRDRIGYYNRLMKSRDWPAGVLERAVAHRASKAGLDVVAFVGATTDYAKVLRRTPWSLAPGRTAQLVTLRGVHGTSVVSRALGVAVRAFVTGRGGYPTGAVVERLA